MAETVKTETGQFIGRVDPARDIGYSLLGIAQALAPNGIIQENLAIVYRDMQKQGESEKAIAMSFAGAIVDGLRHGNWPGLDYSVG